MKKKETNYERMGKGRKKKERRKEKVQEIKKEQRTKK